MLRTVIDATNVGNSRWGPQLVDEDWHAICHAINKGADGVGWENLFLQVCGTAQSGQP